MSFVICPFGREEQERESKKYRTKDRQTKRERKSVRERERERECPFETKKISSFVKKKRFLGTEEFQTRKRTLNVGCKEKQSEKSNQKCFPKSIFRSSKCAFQVTDNV